MRNWQRQPRSTVAGREIYENRRSRLLAVSKQNALLALVPMDAGRAPVGREQTRLGVYHDVLRRLRDAGAPVAVAPDFADKLWTHFHRFNYRYAMDVNVERAEDVLTHMRLLHKATHPENQPAFSVRVVQVPVPTEDDAGEPDSSQSNPTEHDTAATPTRLTAHPEPFFGSSKNLKALVHQASSKNLLNDTDAIDALLRPMHEITFASNDRPKGLTQLSSLLGKLNLDIKEVHALSTNDGYFLDIFIVVGWDHKIPYEFLTPLQAAIGVVQDALRPVIPRGTNTKLTQLIEKCWQQNPVDRPDFTEILQFLDDIIEKVGMDPSKTHKEKEKGTLFSFGKGHG